MGISFDLSLKDLLKHPLTAVPKLATGGLLTKPLNKLTKKTWSNSGIRKEYMKNQRTYNTAAGALAAGVLGPAFLGTTLTGATGAIAPATLGQMVLAGGLMGRKADKKAALQRQQEKELATKAEAGRRLDDYLDDIVADPDSPATGNPSVPPVSLDPSLPGSVPANDPQSWIEQVMGGVSPTGGAANTGGSASRDQQQLLNEAELQYKLQQEQAGMSKSEREKMLQEYANLITSQQQRILDEKSPEIYEDLNRRGLLRSSYLGESLAKERAKAAQILQEQVGLQGLTDRDKYISSLDDASSNYLSGRSGAIKRRYSLEDFARQAQVAKDTGIALQPISTGTPSSKAGDAAMVSAGANVATAMKGK